MKLSELAAAALLLAPHYTDEDYKFGTGHDVLWFRETDTKLSKDEYAQMAALGFYHEADGALVRGGTADAKTPEGIAAAYEDYVSDSDKDDGFAEYAGWWRYCCGRS